MTEIDHDENVIVRPRVTETMGYPLPPEPERFQPKWNQWKQYLLPSPSTGRPTSFARATTVSSTMGDRYNLERWIQRQQITAVMGAIESDDPELKGLVAALSEQITEGGTKVNTIVERISDLSGGRDAAELGTAVHAWLEAVDTGVVRPAEVPDRFKPYVAEYRECLLRHGLEPVAEYVERIVINDAGEETVVGTIDRIYRVVATGELVMGDVKTSKSLDHAWLEYGVQVGGCYTRARLMLSIDGTEWLPMPELNTEFAVLVHIPSDQPERASVVTLDVAFCAMAYDHALKVRDLRRRALD